MVFYVSLPRSVSTVCVSGFSGAQFRDESHPCISVRLGKTPIPRRSRSPGKVVKRMQDHGKVESGIVQGFLDRWDWGMSHPAQTVRGNELLFPTQPS